MIVISRYILKQEGNAYRVLNRDVPLCPLCGAVMAGYDTRKRKSIDDSGERKTLLLRRLRCPQCGVLHLEIPEFLLPHKHYDREVISTVLSGDSSSCPADDSTIRRWKKQNYPPVLPVDSGSPMVSLIQTKVKDGEEE